MTTDLHDASARYGCLECREDAELVHCDRLHPEGIARYHTHLRGCDACRRAHQLLVAVYRGPDPASSGPGLVSRDAEFTAILRRTRPSGHVRWYRNPTFAAIGAAAAVLAFAFTPTRGAVERRAGAVDIAPCCY